MSYLNFFKKKLSHFERARNKKEVIERIVSNPYQHNNDVVNLHRLDPNNVGDFYCAPHHYFDELKGKALDLFDYKNNDDSVRGNWHKTICDNALIIGGGGLLNRPGFNMHMNMLEKLSQTDKKIVFWGVGHNSKSSKLYGKQIKYNITPSNYGLVGVRDYGRTEEWVPCVSCMHPIFDTSFDETREIGIVFHQKTLRNKKVISKFSDFESIANNSTFEAMVEFIASSNIVLTDSYHAMYWAMLFNKKVMVFPNSTKFYDFKYQPVISTFSNYKDDLNKLQSYDGVLEECRTVNNAFAEKAFNYLNL